MSFEDHPLFGCPGTDLYIGKNIAVLCDVVTFANELNLPVAILSLDQEKAFGRVDWSFLLSTLDGMGFGVLSFTDLDSFTRYAKLRQYQLIPLTCAARCAAGVSSIAAALSSDNGSHCCQHTL